jgi:hypothetical protein
VRPEGLCGLLAEPERLAAFAAVVLGAATPAEVAARSGLSARTAVRALSRLEQGGLVSTVEGRLVAHASAFKEACAPAPDPFIRDGRLVQIPAKRGKRLAVLEQIAASFEPGVRYPERAVDTVLRAWHPDYASLRRYLVDEGFMTREKGVYWRSGGPVDV